MAFPYGIYAPPGVYTESVFQGFQAQDFAGLKIPVLIGPGTELLYEENLELTRGSSPVADQEVPEEDLAGRAVVSISDAGVITLGDFNCSRNKIQVRNLPIVTGDGSGTVSTNPGDVTVTINGEAAIALSVDGTNGVIELANSPADTDSVKVTYFFNREDTETTDDVSDQVSVENAKVYGLTTLAFGNTYTIVAGTNDELVITVDQEAETVITLTAGSFTAAQVAALINGQAPGTLAASSYTDNLGQTGVLLSADNDLEVGSGSANATLGFSAGTTTSRNRSFIVFQGPIVDGSNGGITTTDITDVVVTVDGVSVLPASVDGANRTVVLPYAPKVGATVLVTYYFNSWQDTFDYLKHRNVSTVLRCGVTPDRADYTQGVDFVLQDDKIVWGTSALVSTGDSAVGSTDFGSTQISTTLVDMQGYLELCDPVVNTNVTPAVQSRKEFQLPFVPTTGNGRNTPLGSSLFQDVSNSRIDLPTNRPDLVTAYWGFSLQDALDRGPVKVTKVDSDNSTITLQTPIEVGASVWTSFYYNTVQDDTYTFTSKVAGISGVGQYFIEDEDGNDQYGAVFGTKSAGLSTISVEFPSGSELKPGARFESNLSTSFQGPVEEIVTVTFTSTEDTPAKYSVPGSDPYYPISSSSDHARILVDTADLVSGATGLDLNNPTGAGCGFFAHLMGDEVVYDADTGATTYDIDDASKEVSLTVDGVLVSATAATGAANVSAYVTAINTAAASTPPQYLSVTRFNAPFVVTAGEYDQLSFEYLGDTVATAGTQTITLAPGTYNSASDLVTQINARITALGLSYTVTAFPHSTGAIGFTLVKDPGDGAGYLAFIDGAAGQDFAEIAGIDTAAALTGTQTKLYDGPIARRYTVGAGALLHDRILLRNRLCPGSGSLHHYHQQEQTELRMQGVPATTFLGLASQDVGLAGHTGTVEPASVVGLIGLGNGQVATATYGDARDGQYEVVFYDGSGSTAANNVFKFSIDGTPVTVTFTDAAGGAVSGTGSSVPLGPGSITDTVIEQIAAAMVPAFGVSSAAVLAAGYLAVEGTGIRISSITSSSTSRVEIGSGSANSTLGFVDDESDAATAVDVRKLASALMGQHAATIDSYINVYATPTATYFAAEALAGWTEDEVGAEYLYLQSQTTGVSSNVSWSTPTADDALSVGTGLLAVAGEGAVGEAGVDGFYVTSSDPADGSGSANTSVLNSGTGQDGVVGQTYRDLVTGLTFTVLERDGGASYPATNYFTLNVSKSFTTDSNIPIILPGVEVLVTNTTDVTAGNTAEVDTFRRSGNEPSTGDLYYVTYNYRKRDFSHQLYSKLATIEAAYGTISPENPVSLGAYLMTTNGAVLVGIKQVQKATGSGDADLTDYRNAIDDLVTPFAGGVRPDIITPLRGDSLDLYRYLSLHCDVQSDIRHRQERTGLVGFSPSIIPRDAGRWSNQLSSTRMRMVYPDSVTLSLTDATGTVSSYILQGYYMAAALGGSVVSPNVDIATPCDNRILFGFNELGRKLDLVEQNRAAEYGLIVIAERGNTLVVRHGLTTDLTNLLTKIPTVIMSADEVQQRSRAVLNRYIGVKNLAGVSSQVEGEMSSMFKRMLKEQLISGYRGVRAQVAPNDPTVIEVEAVWAPVFPVWYIHIRFQVRSSTNN